MTYGPWDIEGDIIAFTLSTVDNNEDEFIKIARLPDFKVTLNVPVMNYFDKQLENHSQGIVELAISPDQTMLAVLYMDGETLVPRDHTSHYNLGGKCRLIIIDINTGQEIAKASRWASDFGFCWLSNSTQVLFTSLSDESLYEIAEEEIEGGMSYGIGSAADDKYKLGLYQLDVENGNIDRFGDGYYPSLAVNTGDILAHCDNGIVILDSSGTIKIHMQLEHRNWSNSAISPNGDVIIVPITQHSPFMGLTRSVLIDRDQPDIRHILKDSSSGRRIDWTFEQSDTDDKQ